MIRILDFNAAQSLVRRKAVRLEEAERIVAPILADVRTRGDAALLEYARKFDNFEGKCVRIPVEGSLTPEFERAVVVAADNIREYARLQLPRESSVEYAGGRQLGQIVRPLDSMGAYIPAGRYPLPSTLLMTVIPAQVAGVGITCVACPNPTAEILGLSAWLGVTHLFRMGGAQAIAALAYGTETVPKVDRIVGPGNIYVAAAKKLIAGEAGIDFVAGPTEIVIIAAEGNPRWIAADMLAQAEHDVDASSILLTTSRSLARGSCRGNRVTACYAPHSSSGTGVDRVQWRNCDRRCPPTRGGVFKRTRAGAFEPARWELSSVYQTRRQYLSGSVESGSRG